MSAPQVSSKPKRAKAPAQEVPNKAVSVAYERFIGIDPGVKGAMALLDATGKVLDCRVTPTIVTLKSTKTKKGNHKINTEVELQATCDTLREWIEGYTCVMVIEKVQPMSKGEGSVSLWSFAGGFFCWPALAVALRIPYELITPNTWKKGMGLTGDSVAELVRSGMTESRASSMVKERDRQKALQLFPQVSHQLQNKVDHGKADALLLAEYARRTL